jgi:hypothetical protein
VSPKPLQLFVDAMVAAAIPIAALITLLSAKER